MLKVFIIDGYNVMHAREPGGIAGADLDDRRRGFVEDVLSFVATTGDEATVVFDSGSASEPECQPIPHTSVTVCFASASISADILIGKLVQKELAGSGRQIKVVSADWEVQRGAMQERVERVHPRNFIDGMKNFTKKLAKSSKMDKMHWKLEHKVDVETLRKLEEMRRGGSG